MRPHGLVKAVFFCLAGVSGVVVGGQTPASGVSSGEAAAILTAAREALGGDKRATEIKTIVATGRTRQIQGDNLVPIEFEIAVELPDKYVRTDEIPSRESGPSRNGFNGDGLIQSGDPPRRGGPGPGGPPPARAGGGLPSPSVPGSVGAPEAGRGPSDKPADPTMQAKQEFARLTLGMLATSFSAFPLTFGYVGQAEAPEGKADVIDVRGPGSFQARLFIDSKTHLPLMLNWTTPPDLVPVASGQKPPPNMAPGSVVFETPAPPGDSATPEQRKQFEQEALAARERAVRSAKPTEHRIYYADYRDVDGLKFPFRLRRAVGATTTEETIFDRFRLNAKVDPRKFEVRK